MSSIKDRLAALNAGGGVNMGPFMGGPPPAAKAAPRVEAPEEHSDENNSESSTYASQTSSPFALLN